MNKMNRIVPPENSEIETTEITEIRKKEQFEAFVTWFALPEDKRVPKTQKELAKKIAVREATLTAWKNHPDFIPLRRQKMKEWGMDKTPQVLNAIYRRAIDKSTQDAKLWLEVIEDLKEQQPPQQASYSQFNFFSISEEARAKFNERFKKFLREEYYDKPQ